MKERRSGSFSDGPRRIFARKSRPFRPPPRAPASSPAAGEKQSIRATLTSPGNKFQAAAAWLSSAACRRGPVRCRPTAGTGPWTPTARRSTDSAPATPTGPPASTRPWSRCADCPSRARSPSTHSTAEPSSSALVRRPDSARELRIDTAPLCRADWPPGRSQVQAVRFVRW